MSGNKRPDPLLNAGEKKRPVCPVCGTVSYSREGIHPQCSQLRADEVRLAKLKLKESRAAKSKTKPKVTSPDAVKPWHKLCPKCRIQVHVRRSTCECGHSFATSKPLSADTD
jgi:hypothetical protein